MMEWPEESRQVSCAEDFLHFRTQTAFGWVAGRTPMT